MSTTQQRLDERARAIEDVLSTGYCTLAIAAADSVLWFAESTIAGDTVCTTTLAAVLKLVEQIEQRPKHQPIPCWLCDNPLWRDELPYAVGILLPFNVDTPSVGLGLAFCADCARGRSAHELGKAALARLRQDWLPDLKILPPMPPAGHA